MLLQTIRYPSTEEVMLDHGNPTGILNGFQRLLFDVFERQFVIGLITGPVSGAQISRHRHKACFRTAGVVGTITTYLAVKSTLPLLIAIIANNMGNTNKVTAWLKGIAFDQSDASGLL